MYDLFNIVLVAIVLAVVGFIVYAVRRTMVQIDKSGLSVKRREIWQNGFESAMSGVRLAIVSPLRFLEQEITFFIIIFAVSHASATDTRFKPMPPLSTTQSHGDWQWVGSASDSPTASQLKQTSPSTGLLAR